MGKLPLRYAAVLAAAGQLFLIGAKLVGLFTMPWWFVLLPTIGGAISFVVTAGLVLWAANRADSE